MGLVMRTITLLTAMSLVLMACSEAGVSTAPDKTPAPAKTNTIEAPKDAVTPPPEEKKDDNDVGHSGTPPSTAVSEMLEHYDDSWTIGPGWPGEYPNGFSINSKTTVLMGRTEPSLSAKADTPCPMEFKATIHPWNTARIQTDELDFLTATKNVALKVTKDASLDVVVADMSDVGAVKSIPVKAGETITLQQYFAEGFGQIAYNGISYEADLQQLTDFTDSNNNKPLETHEWVKLTCADKGARRVWMLFDEAVKQKGVINTPISVFGVASDLE